MYRTDERRKTLGWILITYVNGSDVEYMSGRIEHLRQAKALIQKKNKVIGRDLELPQTNLLQRPLIQKMEKDIVEEEIETHPLKIWGMML